MTGVQEAPTQTKPALAKIRTDVVGSLLRPEIVKEARIAFDDGKITADALHAIEDEAVREAVRLQEDAGLDVWSPTARCAGSTFRTVLASRWKAMTPTARR
jgi:hypothetical protein